MGLLVICLLIGAGICLIGMHLIAKSMGDGNVKK